jgi:hypothetical protein
MRPIARWVLIVVHVIAWLARTVTNAGIERGQLSGVVLPALEKRTGGQAIDPIIGGYWE